MPSYFFHVKIDLIHSATGIAGLLQRDAKLLITGKASVGGILTDKSTTGKQLEDYSSSKALIEASSDALSPGYHAHADQDWRTGPIYYESVNMLSPLSDNPHKDAGSPSGSIRTGLSSIYPGLSTKARFEPSGKSEEQLGYGIVRLFRDTEETPGLYDLLSSTKSIKHVKKHPFKKHGTSGELTQDGTPAFRNEDCTTLCILTVPTWWDVARLIAFLGEDARDNVSHFRMIRTETAGRYMLLMKFRDGKIAREWRKEWNGKVFDPSAPTEYCHVVFIKSVEVRELDHEGDGAVDPFIDNESKDVTKHKQLPSIASLGSKPMPPPTRPLQEMPTCPVCLERMDDSSGLLTIPCQHTFHCICLVKWRKNGCPVCRFTQDDIVRRGSDPNAIESMNECSVCRSDVNLWICLICGSIGCGRYDGAHAYLHWKQTGHSFSLDMTDQRIWDYTSDGYVHRIMQNKLDGKMMELPSAAGDYDNQTGDEDVIPKAKFDAMGAEYTQLLMSQLDSQRTYYEQKLESAADKASEAARSAAQASDAVSRVVEELSSLQASHNILLKNTIPSLERDRDRIERRATKFEEMSRKMEKAWREEKAVVGSLLEKNAHLEKAIKKTNDELTKLTEKNAELEDTNHDLMTFVSGREKIKELNDPDVKDGTLVVLGPKQNDNDETKGVKTDKKKRRKTKQRGKGGRDEALATLGHSRRAGMSGEDSRSGATTEAEEDAADDIKGKGKEREIIKIHSGSATGVEGDNQ